MQGFEEQVLADLAVLKSQMASLMGNGQPGRLRELEGRVLEHERMLQRAIGIGSGLGALFAIAQVVIDVIQFRG